MPAYFYKSQKAPKSDPMVYIARYWKSNPNGTVTVFSSCDEVELFVNGKPTGKQVRIPYMNLPHPMFEFKNVPFEEGEIKAIIYKKHKSSSSIPLKHRVSP
ncbi:MAG: DUF4982 domain-containing protein [Oscillospiraceae bacterium]|nr:DUF4982 domain-containing protein [Oscillospiraceae bacterium]